MERLEAGITLLRVIVDAKNDTLVLIRGKVSHFLSIPSNISQDTYSPVTAFGTLIKWIHPRVVSNSIKYLCQVGFPMLKEHSPACS